jgi:hypothetical protein
MRMYFIQVLIWEINKLWRKVLISMTNNQNPVNKKKQTNYSHLKDWFFKADIRLLNTAPVVMGMLLLIIIVVVFKGSGIRSIPKPFDGIILACMVFLSSLGGIASIIRRENMWSWNIIIRGKWAVVLGIVWTVICVLSGIIILVLSFTKQ